MPVEAPATWSHSSKVLYTETLTELEVGGGGEKTDYSNISYPITWWNKTNMTDAPEGSLLSQAALSRRRPRRQRLRKQPLEHGGILDHAAPHAARHTRHHHVTSRS